MARAHRTVHHEWSFRAVASANILIRENVTVLDQLGIAAIDALGTRLANSIRRSAHQNGQSFSLILRRKDQRVQAHAVAHSDHLFAFLEKLRDDPNARRRALAHADLYAEESGGTIAHSDEQNAVWSWPGEFRG